MGRNDMKKHIYIDSINWHLNVLYNVNCDNLDSIIDDLKSIGCPDYFVYDIYKNLGNCKCDCGLTYTGTETYMVIFKARREQIINTISHECYHFGCHIRTLFNLTEEETATIVGDTCMKICNFILF